MGGPSNVCVCVCVCVRVCGGGVYWDRHEIAAATRIATCCRHTQPSLIRDYYLSVPPPTLSSPRRPSLSHPCRPFPPNLNIVPQNFESKRTRTMFKQARTIPRQVQTNNKTISTG